MACNLRMLPVSCLLVVSTALFAQNKPAALSCAADEARHELFQRFPERAKEQAALDQLIAKQLRSKKGAKPEGVAQIYTIPVVVHIVHDGGAENISDALVKAAIQHLNDAYAHTDYFEQAGPGVDVQIRFCLARRTPEGVFTTGITRTQSPLTDITRETQDLALKNLIRWDPERYVNVWVVRSISSLSSGPSVAGYAYFPSSHGKPEDGMVCEAQFFGADPTSDAVLIHEMGHYFGLYHTFEGGCKNDDCLLDGDQVCDTPPDMATHTACPYNSCSTDADAPAPNPFSVNVNDMTENFMDYSPFACYYRFTQGQAERAQASLLTIRKSLLESDVCEEPCVPLPVAAFSAFPTNSIAGSPVNFSNSSSGANLYQWYINDVPFSSAPNPVYVFPNPGTYLVKLVITGALPVCVDSMVQIYEVTCPVTASFTASATEINAGQSATFSGSAASASTFQWHVNGILAGTSLNLSYPFPSPGTFTVVFTASNGICEASYTLQILVKSKCPCPEICDNGVDDDEDGYLDCYDSDCNCFDGADCTVLPPPNNFSMREAWRSGSSAIPGMSIPIVANLNPLEDDMPEIIVSVGESGKYPKAYKLFIYQGDGSNKNNPDLLPIPLGFYTYSHIPPVAGDIDRDGKVELVMTQLDKFIRVYRDFKRNTNPAMSLWITSDVAAGSTHFRPMLADLDGDGTPEVIAGNEIFRFDFSGAAPALKKVLDGATGPTARTVYANYIWESTAPTVADVLQPADCGGDPDCNGLELVAGSVIYSIDMDPADGDGYQIKIQRNLNTMVSGNIYDDGYTAVADMDLDGTPDIVVTSRRRIPNSSTAPTYGTYVWNKNGLVKFIPNPVTSQYCGSFPTIANVYDDTKQGYAKDYPEIIITTALRLVCQNLHLNAAAPTYGAWWILNTTDLSGNTGSTVFDFNGDGLSEIVYRDQDFLRIVYGGPAPFPAGVDIQRNWSTAVVKSATMDEYPVVADLDNDGQAEIAVTGVPTSGTNNSFGGYLNVFETANAPWKPCRPIWNQINYNIVNVNDDLSIPTVPQKQWAEFPGPGGGKYPLNMYLAQLSSLGGNFSPAYPVPDASAVLDSVSCEQLKLNIRLTVCNQGSSTLPVNTPLQFYTADPTAGPAPVHGAPLLLPVIVPVDSCYSWTVNVNMPLSASTLWGVVNDNGSKPRPFDLTTDFPSTSLPECFYPNNIFSVPVAYVNQTPDLGPDRVLCSSSTETLHPGSGFVKYRWQDGATDSTYTAANPGKYWVDVWDVCGNKLTDTVTISHLNIPGFNLGPDRVVCSGDSVVLNVTGFSTITWSPLASVNCPDCPSVSLYPDSNLTVRVTGQAGNCISSDSIRVSVLPKPHVETVQITSPPCGRSDGGISLSAAGGEAPFLFDWSVPASGAQVDGLPAGTYTVTVTNAGGCRSIDTLTVPGVDTLAWAGAQATPVQCFGGADGAIGISLGGGTLPYQFDWTGSLSGDTLSGLPAGTYSVTATDAHGCTLTTALIVTEPAQLTLAAVIDSSSCAKNSGDISLSAAGGTPGYSFKWAHGPTEPALTGLPPGDYSVVATDAHGCSQLRAFTIEPGGSPTVAASNITQVACFGESNGKIEAAFSGGVPPYQYNWPAGPGSNVLANLPAGNYTLTTTDAKGCSLTTVFAVAQPALLGLAAAVDQTTCTSTTGSISVEGQGGVAPYSYSWDSGEATPAITDVQPDDYTVQITDANGCTYSRSFTIEPGGTPAVSETNLTPVDCHGGQTGQIAVTLAGGVAPYQYHWSTGPGNSTATGLAAGPYSLTFTDAKGCTATAQFTVTEPPLLSLTAAVDSTTCANTTGGLSAAGLGGVTPYAYKWSNGQITPALTGLAPGVYSVVITDANGCTATQSFTLLAGKSPALSSSKIVPVRCFGESNGQIEVNIAGGRPPYAYGWSSGPGAEILSDLPAGAYSLTVSDAIGCSATVQFTVTEPPLLEAAIQTSADTCAQKTGVLKTLASGGTPPYQYLWNNGKQTKDLMALPAGWWSVTVTDANGCIQLRQAEVPAVEIEPVFSLFADTITCARPQVKAGSVPAPGDWHFLWKTPAGALLPGAAQLFATAGNYSVTATNNFGCTAVQAFDIQVDTLHPKAQAAVAEVILPCDKMSVTLDGAASAAGAAIVARWYLEADGQVKWDTLARSAEAVRSGTYILQITDLHNGCSGFDTTEVTAADRIDGAFVYTDSVSCFGLKNGTVRVESVDGGTAPYVYSIDNLNFSPYFQFAGLPAGTYPVFIRDAQGCLWQGNATVGQPDSLSVALLVSDTLIALGEPVVLKALVLPPDAALNTIEWTPEALFPPAMDRIRQAYPEAPTVFGVRIQTLRGCEASAEARVRVLRENVYLPNALNPERPGNDAFTVFGGADVQAVQLMRIYDRWGELLFERKNFPPNDPSLGWNGTYREQYVAPGVYLFHLVVELADERTVELTGNITVVR